MVPLILKLLSEGIYFLIPSINLTLAFLPSELIEEIVKQSYLK